MLDIEKSRRSEGRLDALEGARGKGRAEASAGLGRQAQRHRGRSVGYSMGRPCGGRV